MFLRIRDELADRVFLGENLGPAQVRFASGKGPAGCLYGTFRSRRTGQRVCILTCSEAQPVHATIQAFEGNINGPVRVYAPFKKAYDATLPVEITVEPERLVFVAERGKTGGRMVP